MVGKQQVQNKVCLDVQTLSDQLDVIRGAVMICFPMGLPAYDPVRINLEGAEGVTGKGPNAAIDPGQAQLWFSGKQMIKVSARRMPPYPNRFETAKKMKAALLNTRTGLNIALSCIHPNAAVARRTSFLTRSTDRLIACAVIAVAVSRSTAKTNALSAHVGKHEKTKAIVRLQGPGAGPPARENPVDAETQKAMLAFYHKRQEEMKSLESDDADDYANSAWANTNSLKTHFSGVGNVRFR